MIERGDFLWTDFGINYAGMHTDMQHMGYVLHEGEGAPPDGLVAGLSQTNRMQDLILEEMRPVPSPRLFPGTFAPMFDL